MGAEIVLPPDVCRPEVGDVLKLKAKGFDEFCRVKSVTGFKVYTIRVNFKSKIVTEGPSDCLYSLFYVPNDSTYKKMKVVIMSIYVMINDFYFKEAIDKVQSIDKNILGILLNKCNKEEER